MSDPTQTQSNIADPEALLTEVQAAELLQVTPRAVQKWRATGTGPPLRSHFFSLRPLSPPRFGQLDGEPPGVFRSRLGPGGVVCYGARESLLFSGRRHMPNDHCSAEELDHER